MKNRSTKNVPKVVWYRRNVLLWLALLAAVIGGFLTYYLSDIPFGPLFDMSVLLCPAGLLALPDDAHSYPPIIYPTYDYTYFP